MSFELIPQESGGFTLNQVGGAQGPSGGGLNLLVPQPGITDSEKAVARENLKVRYAIQLEQTAAPSTAPTATVGSAGNVSGLSGYYVTFVTAEGETELGPASGNVSPSSQRVELTNIPIGPTGTTARKIYRANIAQGEWPRLLATISNNTATTFTDNIATASVTLLPLEINTTGGVIYNGSTPIMVADASATILGFGSGLKNTTKGNTYIGNGIAPNQTTAYWMTGVGSEVFASITSGYEDTAIGRRSCNSLTTGKYMTAVGAFSAEQVTTASDGCYIGVFAGLKANGQFNNLIGVSAMQETTTCNQVDAIGYRAGTFLNDGTTPHTNCEKSVFIGSQTTSGADNSTNQIVIGCDARGLGNNTTVLGNLNTTLCRLWGRAEAANFSAKGQAAGQIGFYGFHRENGTRVGFIGNDSDNQISAVNEVGGGFNFNSNVTTTTSFFNHKVYVQETLRCVNLLVDNAVEIPSIRVNSGGNDSYINFSGDNNNYLGNLTNFRTSAGGIKATIDGATGRIVAGASTTSAATLNIPHGTAPTSPVNGDIWTTTAGLFVRINGTTIGPIS